MSLILPTLSQHSVIIGKNGTGKTVFGTWMLSEAAYDVQPFIIIDFKRDPLLGQIRRAVPIRVGTIPRFPGVYIVRPNLDESEALEAYLLAIWKRGRIGLFCDEATLLPRIYQPGAVRTIFVTGRTKRIPFYACTQRPVGVSPYIFSEASFFACFYLQKPGDTATFAEFTPWSPRDIAARLPAHWCRWYDSPRHFSTVLKPCPNEADILQTFEDRLRPVRRII